MIRHTVVFKLKDQISSLEKKNFFINIKKLVTIPGVKKFECLKQISKGNSFDFGLSMEFDNSTLYDQYSDHPQHSQFLEQYWLKDVEDYMEIDFEPLIDF
jgi:hypothetical protein